MAVIMSVSRVLGSFTEPELCTVTVQTRLEGMDRRHFNK